jgi:hypothetical protein
MYQPNNVLTTKQYGFRNNSSTEKNSYKLINEILPTFNNKLKDGGIYCDLEKNIQLQKSSYTIVKMLILWIQGQNQCTVTIETQ